MRLVLIFQCIIGLHSQSIDYKNALAQADITGGEPVFVELSRYFKSDGGQCDVVIRLKKIIYGEAKDAGLSYKLLRNSLLDCGFVLIKVDPCLFMSKTEFLVIYVDDFLFWKLSQSDIAFTK